MIFQKFGFRIDFDQDDDIDTRQFDNMTVEEFLGLMLHGQQQGVNKVYYKGYLIEASRMADTNGSPVTFNTQLTASFEIEYDKIGSLLELQRIHNV